MKKLAAVSIAALPLMLANCLLYSGRCLYETRYVNADGALLENNMELVSAQLVETEQRDYQPDKDFSWQILGPDFKGHVQRIVLQDTGGGSSVVYEFPVNQDPRQVLSSGFVRQSEGANLNGFFDLLSSGRAVVVITTDVPGRTTLTIPLSTVRQGDWSRPYCS